ncbi:MAG: outer-membrane lipoprotein carrier protein LolA [Pelagibacteraceae bacterium]|jgi:outer membrane lipoprotein-sorting protein|nr:outer-membrane lipoprotein carrier protein LolA [Pelagibacteraceae bacterium]
MWEKGKFCRLKSIKKKLFFLILFTLFSQKSFSLAKEKIINNFNKINNISFEFQQKIDDKIEVGKCYIKYPKLIYCLYDNKNKKEMVSNGKSLVIKNNRYNKTYIYPLKTTPLEYILDKEFILNKIKNLEPKININKMIEFSITNESNLLSVFFDSKTYNLSGWKTIDIYQNEVFFQINNLEKNININENQFKLPPLN